MEEMKQDEKFDRNLAFLREMFPDRVYINVKEFARVYSIGVKTVYNWLCLDKCPVKPKKFGSKPLWSLTDIAQEMSNAD